MAAAGGWGGEGQSAAPPYGGCNGAGKGQSALDCLIQSIGRSVTY